MIQDRILNDKAQLLYGATNDDGTPVAAGTWGPAFFGNLPVINGAISPHLDVEPRLYRLRILNASNSRFFNLYFNLASSPFSIPSLVPFYQIGSDGGLLPQSVKLQKLLLGPAERADVIIDFSAAKGKTVTLSNDAMSPYPGWQVPAADIRRTQRADAISGSPAGFRGERIQHSPSDAVRGIDGLFRSSHTRLCAAGNLR